MHIKELFSFSRTKLTRCSMEQSTIIIVPWLLHTTGLQLWRQKLPVFRESWQDFLEETLLPKPRYQSHQHLQALKIRYIYMIGWARLLSIVQYLVLYQIVRKSYMLSSIYVLPPAHIWNYIITRFRQDQVLVLGVTLPKNSKIFMDNEITRREQRRN